MDNASNRKPPSDLSPIQNRALALLLSGKTHREVAEAVGVRENCVARWRKEPAFARELERGQRELMDAGDRKLRAIFGEALEVLRKLLHSDDEHVALGAGAVLSQAALGLPLSVDEEPILTGEELRMEQRRMRAEILGNHAGLSEEEKAVLRKISEWEL